MERNPNNAPPYAHTKNDEAKNSLPQGHWEPLFSADCPSLSGDHTAICEDCQNLATNHGHLNKVAYHTARFAEAMFIDGSDESKTAFQWGYLAGLWHDLGKFAPEWQDYLASKADPHIADAAGTVDHSTPGAQHAVTTLPLIGHLLAYAIAGHHSGLLDTTSNGSCQQLRLSKTDLPTIPCLPDALVDQAPPTLPQFLEHQLRERTEHAAFSASFFSRVIFSNLVDADFLATEAFMNPGQRDQRNAQHSTALANIQNLVTTKIASFGTPRADDTVNVQRSNVVADCIAAANQEPGFFSLTVPTGGGKTLSSLAFALRHALAHGQRRIIYVVPFTSIIEQNANVIREILAPLESDTFTPLIEHHSALSPEKETTQSRLATENWDAPIIITTAVQFYESLFAAKTSRNRKLHHITNSVVILDEAQSLPVNYLTPCLRVLQELADHYHTTTVLCTATQPAIGHSEPNFPIGLRGCREIISDTASLFTALKRVQIKALGALDDVSLGNALRSEPSVLCIVNRRRHAQELFARLGESEENYHLSALMCPEHRSRVLNHIRTRLSEGLPTRLISTQLIEAGVDIDFPVVYRALAGLDSIAQAAGRCNRHGYLEEPGRVYIFKPDDQRAEAYFRETAQVADQIIGIHDDLLGQEAIAHYFDLYYYQQSQRWDEKHILENFELNPTDKNLPFLFGFRKTAEDFRLIENWQVPVIIPFDSRSQALIAQLRNPKIPLHRDLLRGLQRYTVQISPKLRDQNRNAFESLQEDQFHILISPELNYSDKFGLKLDEEHSANQFLNVNM